MYYTGQQKHGEALSSTWSGRFVCRLTWIVALTAQVVLEVSVERPLPDDELRAARAQAAEAAPYPEQHEKRKKKTRRERAIRGEKARDRE